MSLSDKINDNFDGTQNEIDINIYSKKNINVEDVKEFIRELKEFFGRDIKRPIYHKNAILFWIDKLAGEKLTKGEEAK